MIPQHTDEIANEIRLLRPQRPDCSFLVVEGYDDSRFMWKFIARESCEIVVAHGKQSVIDAINTLESENFAGVLGMIDADFARVQAVEIASANIVMPEYHDLDAMLVHSPAFDQVLDEFASVAKLNQFGKNVLQVLIDSALKLAYLRLYSLRNNLGLRFRNMRHSAWLDSDSLDADTDKLIREIKNRSQRQDLSSDQLGLEMKAIENSQYDPREMCNGTDLIGILSVGLRRILGTNNATSVGVENLRRSFRLTYHQQDFIQSSLYAQIKAWEARVDVFRVLRF